MSRVEGERTVSKITVSRRFFLGAMGGTAAVIVLKGLNGLESLFLTDAQRRAIEQFNNTPDRERLDNVLIVGSKGAYLRSSPDSFSDDNYKGANIKGYLEPQARVRVAILVKGNDPSNPTQKSRSTWYFIPELDHLGNAKSGLFSHSGNFTR